MITYYDVTLPLFDRTPVWPGDPQLEVTAVSNAAAGDSSTVSALRLSSHAGTHVDAPRHLFPGAPGVDTLPLATLVGEAWVCRFPADVPLVTADALQAAGIPKSTRRLLLATANGALWDRSPWEFSPDDVGLAPDAAGWVVDRGMALLGIDYLSVDPAAAEDLPAHRILLSHDVVVVENLDLRAVPPGAYHLLCLPIKLANGDGAPARVVLSK